MLGHLTSNTCPGHTTTAYKSTWSKTAAWMYVHTSWTSAEVINYRRDSLLWLQVIRSENDVQKNCSGTFRPQRSSSGTKVQEGSSWSKCHFVPDFCSQNVVPLQILCTSAMELSLHYLCYLAFFQVIITSIYVPAYHFQWRDERMPFSGPSYNLVAVPNTIIHGTYNTECPNMANTALTDNMDLMLHILGLHVY